jgi:hypothetical protein
VLSMRERPNMRSLTLADFSEEWQDLGDLGDLWSKLPALERLVLQGESMNLGRLALPAARDVAVRGTLRQSELASIAAARWPRIERLEILFGDPTCGAEGCIEDIRAILAGTNMPQLRHLGLKLCAFAEDIVSDLDQLQILPQLEALDLSLCDVSDDAQNRLYAQRKKLAHLRVLRLGDGPPVEWIYD